MDNPAQLLTQVGIMNKISQTGNTVVDLLLCIVLPLLLTQIAPHFDRMRQWWQAFLMRGSKKWQREISFVRRDGWYYRDDDEAPNNLLQQAIIMYMSTNEDLCSQYVNAQLALGKKPVQREDDVAGKHGKDGSESDSDDYAYDTARQLKQYQVNTVPPLDHWVDLGDLAEGVEFMRTESVMERGDGKRSDTTVTFHLQSARKNGPELIDAFVDAAYHYYRAALEEKSEKLRYLYSPTHAEGNDDSQKGVVYKRYQLSDEKTFASLFHPQKASLLRLVDHFLHKTGKFAIPGYQHKLGLLLHGPPGTGKTSLVKALAHYTDRNIISVPLSQISTNQQLQDIVFDQVFKVVGDDLPYNLPFSKTIFLLEDVDAACDVVKRRSPGPASPAQIAALSAAAAANAKRKASPASRQRRSERSSDCSDSSGDENSGCEQRHRQRSPAGSGEGDVDGGLDGPLVPFGPEKKGAAGLMAGLEHPDKLNLAGLLNVLDGVVCCPNRIVVMTTNHLSKLDPALIRPGRVSKQIFMGNLVLESALQMVEHYFCCLSGGKLTAGEVAAFTAVFEDGELSPAELEMRCCDVDTVDELVAALRDRHVV